MKKFSMILAVLLIAAMLLPVAACAETVVLAYSEGSLNLRRGPGTEYRSVAILHDGDEITVLREGDVWSKIETEDGDIGYIKNLYIEGISDEYADGTEYYDGGVIMYTTGSVRFRAGASTDTASMGTFSKGTKLTVLGENDRFYLVKDAQGRQGFVSSLYMSKKYVASAGSSSSAISVASAASGSCIISGSGCISVSWAGSSCSIGVPLFSSSITFLTFLRFFRT